MDRLESNNCIWDRPQTVSFGCVAVCVSFFIVLARAPMQLFSGGMSQIFRPILILALLPKLLREGAVRSRSAVLSVALAIYCLAAAVMTGLQTGNLLGGGAAALFALMYAAVVAAAWNVRETKLIVFTCFFAAVVCAVILTFSNPFMDFTVANTDHVKLFHTQYNRNTNAYCYAIGTILGLNYLIYGKRSQRSFTLIGMSFVVYALLYSQCRGAFLCAVLGSLISLYGKFSEIRRVDRARYYRCILLTVIMVIVLYFLIKNSSMSRIVDGESTSGRDEGIRRALRTYQNADLFGKIFGCGFTYEESFLKTGELLSHFVYTNFLISIGMVGFVILILFFLSCVFESAGAISLSFLVCGLLRTCFESLDYYIYIPLILAALLSCCARRNGVRLQALFVWRDTGADANSAVRR